VAAEGALGEALKQEKAALASFFKADPDQLLVRRLAALTLPTVARDLFLRVVTCRC